MKYFIIVLTLIPFITLGQCFEIKNDNGVVIKSSTDENSLSSVGEKYKDTLIMSISKMFDGVDFTYSIVFAVKSVEDRKYLDKSVIIPISPNPVAIDIGKEKFDSGIYKNEIFNHIVMDNILERDLKRLFFGEGFLLIAFDDKYTVTKDNFKRWKDKYSKCIFK